MVFIDSECDPSLDERLSNFEARLLDFCVRRMNEQNEVRLSQGEIARSLKKHAPDISKALKTLRTAGYLTVPQQGVILINPDVAWRGALESNIEACERW